MEEIIDLAATPKKTNPLFYKHRAAFQGKTYRTAPPSPLLPAMWLSEL